MIFEDASRRRWQITRRIGLFLLICTASFSALYLYSSHRTFVLPATADVLSASSPDAWMSTYRGIDIKTIKPTPVNQAIQRRAEAVTVSSFSIKTLQKQPGYFVVGFLAQADKASVASFVAHADTLDAIIPDWYSLPRNGTTACEINEQINEPVRDLLHQQAVAIIPRLSNSDADGWQVDELRAILRVPNRRSCLAQSVANAVRRTDSKGVNIDFEGLSLEDRPYLSEFFIELAERLHTQQQLLTIDIPVNSAAFDLHALSVLSDAIILMAYDQHDPTSRPGPIAAQDWVKSSLQQALAIIPSDKLILGTANYSYDWTIDTPTVPAYSSSYKNTLQLANDVSAKPEMDIPSQNIRFGYKDSQDRRHEVWLLDGNTLWNQHRLIQSELLLGASLWRLGLEDPSIWSFLGQAATGTLPNTAIIEPFDGRLFDHGSEIFSLSTEAQTGTLNRRSSEEGEILAAQYLTLPTSYTVERIGQPIPKDQLILTFVDDLDPTWTPKILDVLNEHKIPALFSLTSAQVKAHPSLVKELAKHNVLIGSTIKTYAGSQEHSPLQFQEELNNIQREIISLTGKKITLFQIPKSGDPSSVEPNTAQRLSLVARLGYISLDSSVDIRTQQGRSSEDLVKQVTQRLAQPGAHVITLRDMGGEETLATLTTLIPELLGKGYTFARLDEAIQVTPERLAPTASLLERIQSLVLKMAASIRDKQWVIIAYIFLFTNVFSLARILLLAVFVLRSKHLKKRPSATTKQTLITVVVPAYNEEKTIRRTLASVQRNTHTNLVAMVVNDGSTDKTAKIVEQMRLKDPRIQLINKPNGGKFSALNLAFEQATTDIIVTIDADTILYPRTINALIAPFEDPKVDAVCGNVEVGNVCNLLTGFQALEYITSQNFDRRAFEELNCIGVVPGATGAWRRQRVLEIGGYEADTLVEDADVTLRLLKHGGKIVYAPEARSRTEAPATLRDLSKQRLRWSFGTFQCLRKHAGSFFHGTLGWIALPNIFFFQILYPILSPIGDLVFLWAIFTGQVSSILVGYLFFILIDFVGSVLAFRLEKRSPKLLLLIFIQRFFYRQFMYIIAFRSILAILRGTRQGWNKLTREGSVHAKLQKNFVS